MQQALAGQRRAWCAVNDAGETIVSVAVPIQRFRAVRGVLLLSTQGGDIDAIIASERFALLQVFLVAALVMIVLSLFLAGAIAGPVRRLAEAAERVRWGTKVAPGDPRLHRPAPDEIGHLSGALRDMTQGALQPDRRHRELRRRRGARAEEPADLAAQRRRDPAARPERRSRSG